MGKHTVGMAFRQGYLEVTPEVRSVPLGAKRKRGRPKKQGHCLEKSPPPPPPPQTCGLEPLQGEPGPAQDQPWLVLADTDCEEEVSIVSNTNKKRIRHEEKEHDDDEEDQSVVGALLGQARSVYSKPPKKAARQARSKAGGSKEDTENPQSLQPASPKRPPSITCKKSKKTCPHEIVFGKHYNKALWSKYAEHVKTKKSTVEIDPNYDM